MNTMNPKFISRYESGMAIPNYWKDCTIIEVLGADNLGLGFVKIQPEDKLLPTALPDVPCVEERLYGGNNHELVEIRRSYRSAEELKTWVGKTIRQLQESRKS